LALLNAAISSGDLGGGSSFDNASVLALEAQAQSFASLPTGTSGSRVTDDSFNYPISLLQARLSALEAEANSFTTVSGRLLDILSNETVLLDEILAGDALNQWAASIPQLLGAWAYGWDFSIGQGLKSASLTNVDPANLVVYNQELPTLSVLNCTSGTLSTGLGAPQVVRTFPIKNASWSYYTTGIPQELYAPDMTWTQLDLLETLPRVAFSASPSAQVIFPTGGLSISGILSFTGQVPGGALPTYVRVLFYPRRNQMNANVSNGVALQLSSYSIDPNSVVVLSTTGSQLYSQATDFNTDAVGTMTPIDIGVDVPVVVYFSEYWPAYQCSMDQANWSDIVMLDVNRPYRDDETQFAPVNIQDGLFPLTDETGTPTGLYFQPLVLLTKQYTVLVTTPATGAYGPSVVLELDIEQPSFMNSINLSPYAAFPVTLQSVVVEGLTSNVQSTVFSGSFLMEGAVQITFPRQIVNKVYLTMVQESYTIEEYQQVAPDALQRSVMNNLQSSLPFAMRGATPAVPVFYYGYQYEIGFEDMVASDSMPSLPGVFVQGPLIIQGRPDVMRVDAQTSGTVSMYLCYVAYNAAGVTVDENLQGLPITPSTSIVFPFSSLLDRTTVASVGLSMRFVLRSQDAFVSKYYIQATLT